MVPFSIMNLKNRLLYSLLGIAIIIVCGLTVRIWKSPNQSPPSIEATDSITSILIDNIKYTAFVHKNQNQLDKSLSSNTLIYRYSENVCEKCIQEDLEELRKLQSKIGKEHILIITSFPNHRNTFIRLNNELKHFRFKNIDSLKDMPINDFTGLSMRYMGFITNEKEFLVFFPVQGKRSLTHEFFSLITLPASSTSSPEGRQTRR